MWSVSELSACIKLWHLAILFQKGLSLIFENFQTYTTFPTLKDSMFVKINLLTPNDPYSGRTAPLTSKCYILYIYSTNIGTEYFKHGIYCPFFPLQNAVCFIILTYLAPVLFTFFIQGVLKLKKNNSGAKRLTFWCLTTTIVVVTHR